MKDINNLVDKVIQEIASQNSDKILTEAKNKLSGGQKYIAKQADPKNKITGADFAELRKKKKETKEDDMEEGNVFTAKLAQTKKGEKFKLGNKTYTDTSDIDEMNEEEPLYRGTKFACEDTDGDDIEDVKPYRDMKTSVSPKLKNESLKKSLVLSENELIDLIEKVVQEQTQVGDTNKALKADKTENTDYYKAVKKKMSDYVKKGSKGNFETNPTTFPKGNGELAKMDKKAYTPSKAVEEYIENFAYSPGMENLSYDEIKPNDDWMEMNIEGSPKTGNGAGANAIDTGLGKKINAKRKANLYGKEKQRSYNRVTQPVDNAGESKGSDKLDDMFSKLGESEEKKSKLIKEDMDKIFHMMSYNKKTQ